MHVCNIWSEIIISLCLRDLMGVFFMPWLTNHCLFARTFVTRTNSR
jgi:hypothetical protein